MAHRKVGADQGKGAQLEICLWSVKGSLGVSLDVSF